MTLTIVHHGDVSELHMTSPGSRAVGMGVSAFVMRGVMVDAGFHRARNELLAAVRQLRVEGAVITHWHEDHAGNVATLATVGLPMDVAPDTEATLRARPDIQLYRRVVWGHPPALTTEVSRFTGHGLDALHTPGHSSDHRVFWDAHTGTLFSGDLWLGVRARILHSTEDPYRILESLRAVRSLGPARMFDAHRGAVDDPSRAIDAKIEWLGATLDAVERAIATGASDREIVRGVMGGEDRVAVLSRGDYSIRNFVKAVRRAGRPT